MRDGTTVERDGNDLVVSIPMTLARGSGRKGIIVPDGLAEDRSAGPARDALIDALARAHYWQGLIDEGRYRTVTELAEGLGMGRSYLGRVLRLTLLAPDIVEGIFRGAGVRGGGAGTVGDRCADGLGGAPGEEHFPLFYFFPCQSDMFSDVLLSFYFLRLKRRWRIILIGLLTHTY
jgi:hypothetical protein